MSVLVYHISCIHSSGIPNISIGGIGIIGIIGGNHIVSVLSSKCESKCTHNLFSDSQVLTENNILICCLSVDFFAKMGTRYYLEKKNMRNELANVMVPRFQSCK